MGVHSLNIPPPPPCRYYFSSGFLRYPTILCVSMCTRLQVLAIINIYKYRGNLTDRLRCVCFTKYLISHLVAPAHPLCTHAHTPAGPRHHKYRINFTYRLTTSHRRRACREGLKMLDVRRAFGLDLRGSTFNSGPLFDVHRRSFSFVTPLFSQPTLDQDTDKL